MHKLATLVVLLGFLAACGDEARPAQAVDGAALQNGTWVLKEAPPSVPTGLALRVERPYFNGDAPCNGFLGDWSDEIGPANGVNITAAGCDDAVNQAETAYVAMLGQVTSVRASQEELVLSGPTFTLTYVRSVETLTPSTPDLGETDDATLMP